MGWDSYTNTDLIDKPDLEDKDLGFKEFEVEEDVAITVKYKILAKDESDLIEKKLYLGGQELTLKDDNLEKAYDIRIKNWGTDNAKEDATGKGVVKTFWEEKGHEDHDPKEYDLELDYVGYDENPSH
jgi:hypothetical protein